MTLGQVIALIKALGGSGGGFGLPTPTADDVGKVATVVDNSGTYEYGLETPSSGGGVLVVNVTQPSDDTITLDKTWQEIKDADAVSIVFDNTEIERSFFFCSDVFERVPIGGVSAQYCVTIQRISGDGVSPILFVASSASGYPSATMG